MSYPRKSNQVIILGIALSAFAIPHRIDDSLFGIPVQFGLSNKFSQMPCGLLMVFQINAIIMSARILLFGYWLSATLGTILALAIRLRHIPRLIKPDSYWSDLLSEILVLGVLVTINGLLLASLRAIQKSRGQAL